MTVQPAVPGAIQALDLTVEELDRSQTEACYAACDSPSACSFFLADPVSARKSTSTSLNA